jgi:hypothetical protein
MFKIVGENYSDYLLSSGDNLILVPQENVGKIIFLKDHIDHIECIRNFKKHIFSKKDFIEYIVFLNDGTSFRAISDEKTFLKIHHLAKYTKCENTENHTDKNIFIKNYFRLFAHKIPVVILFLSVIFAIFIFGNRFYNGSGKIFSGEPRINIIYPQGDSIKVQNIENGLYLEVQSNGFEPKKIEILVNGSVIYQKQNAKDIYYQWFPPNPGIYKVVARSQNNGKELLSKPLTVYVESHENANAKQVSLVSSSKVNTTKVAIGNPTTIYSDPNGSEIIGTIESGSKIDVVEKATTNNSKLYSLNEDLDLYTDGAFIKFKKGEVLRLYDVSGDVLTLMYRKDDSIELVRLQNSYLQKVDSEEWYKVIYNGKEGWISSFFTK